jgi:hypothetical protein
MCESNQEIYCNKLTVINYHVYVESKFYVKISDKNFLDLTELSTSRYGRTDNF